MMAKKIICDCSSGGTTFEIEYTPLPSEFVPYTPPPSIDKTDALKEALIKKGVITNAEVSAASEVKP